MSSQASILQRFFDAVEQRTTAVAQDLLAPDVVVHAADGPLTGRSAVMVLVHAGLEAFRDVHITHGVVSESPGIIVASFEARGVQEQPLLSLQPSGRESLLKGLVVCWFSGDVISKIHVFADLSHFVTGGARVAERTGTEAQGATEPGTTESPSVQQIWLAGLVRCGRRAYGSRLLALVSVGRRGSRAGLDRPAARRSKPASAASAAVKGIGETLKSRVASGEAAIAQPEGPGWVASNPSGVRRPAGRWTPSRATRCGASSGPRLTAARLTARGLLSSRASQARRIEPF
jgi:hypothetical protein